MTTNTNANWREFGFSETELKTVEEGAEVFKFFKGDIENVFKLGRALRTLKNHNYGRGGQGDYALALIQYGFTNRKGGPLDEAIRSNVDKMLDEEDAVRRWWKGVPESKRYGWNNANTIYQHWQEYLDPTIVEKRRAARIARAAAKAAKAGSPATQAQIDAIANAALNPEADPEAVLAAIRSGSVPVGARPPGVPEGEVISATDMALATAREYADLERQLAEAKQQLAELREGAGFTVASSLQFLAANRITSAAVGAVDRDDLVDVVDAIRNVSGDAFRGRELDLEPEPPTPEERLDRAIDVIRECIENADEAGKKLRLSG